MHKAVFLDRDGTIIEDVGYPHERSAIKFLPLVSEAISILNQNGYRVIVTTNQSGVARGYFTEDALRQINQYIRDTLAARGAVIDRVYYCPHHVEGTIKEYRKACDCRKPNPGMIQQATRELDIDLKRSFAIGDKPLDVEAGRRAGCRTILLGDDTGDTGAAAPDYVAADLYRAVEWLLKVGPRQSK